MPRTVSEWIEAWSRRLPQVEPNMRIAKAGEMVRAVRNMQNEAPKGKGSKWRRQGSQKSRGYKILHNSIKPDFDDFSVVTDHPGADPTNKGGIARPKTKRYMPVSVRNWLPGQGGFYVRKTPAGNLAVFKESKRGRGLIYGLFLKQAVIPGSHWIEKGEAATRIGQPERIAKAVLPLDKL